MCSAPGVSQNRLRADFLCRAYRFSDLLGTAMILRSGNMRWVTFPGLWLFVVVMCHATEPVERGAVWEGEVGYGFREKAWNVGISLGGGVGDKILGSHRHHDFLLGNVHAGIMGPVLLDGSLLRGNVELRGELFGGHQIEPSRYVAGLTPALRYHFATGTPLVPFVQAGAGVSMTDIRGPDLSTKFEFNLMAGVGLNYFVAEQTSLSLEYRLFHLSNAGIDSPNTGVNSHVFFLGISWWH